MSTTNPRGAGLTADNITIMGVDVAHGHQDHQNYVYETLQTNFLGSGVAFGRFDADFDPGFLSDRAPNMPSGYNADGTISYGDGKLNTNTTFPEDFEQGGHPSGSFQFGTSAGPYQTLWSRA